MIDQLILKTYQRTSPHNIKIGFGIKGRDELIEKWIRTDDIPSQEPLEDHVVYTILMRIREAERDAACIVYGDEWKEHVAWGDFYKLQLTDAEVRAPIFTEIQKAMAA